MLTGTRLSSSRIRRQPHHNTDIARLTQIRTVPQRRPKNRNLLLEVSCSNALGVRGFARDSCLLGHSCVFVDASRRRLAESILAVLLGSRDSYSGRIYIWICLDIGIFQQCESAGNFRHLRSVSGWVHAIGQKLTCRKILCCAGCVPGKHRFSQSSVDCRYNRFRERRASNMHGSQAESRPRPTILAQTPSLTSFVASDLINVTSLALKHDLAMDSMMNRCTISPGG